ncbi:hypothetical protein ABG067_007867, partial [Albugo candida]
PACIYLGMSAMSKAQCSKVIPRKSDHSSGPGNDLLREKLYNENIKLILKPGTALEVYRSLHIYIKENAIHLVPKDPPTGSFIDIDNVFDENTGWSSEVQSLTINGETLLKTHVNFDIGHTGIAVPEVWFRTSQRTNNLNLVMELRLEDHKTKTVSIVSGPGATRTNGKFVSIGRDLMEEAGIELFKKGGKYMVRYPGDHVDGQTSQTTEYSL